MEVTEEEAQQVEAEVQELMEGRGLEVTLCDVGLDQSKPATLKKNVTYIVCGVIFNDKEEVLMVQEAKTDCYKQWYLPAGRVEVGESLEEALKREVKEEAGFDCEPITLLLIQEQGPQWIRFIYLAKITGGSLKELSSADHESLQACWWDRTSPLQLRGWDILRPIQSGLRYRGDPWHAPVLPVDMSCRHVLQRLILVYTGTQDQVWILLGRVPGLHLPIAAALKTHAVTWASNSVVQDALPASYHDHDVNTLGIFSLQHHGREHGKTDGICLNTLVRLVPDHVQRDRDGLRVPPPPTDTPPHVENPRYLWHQVHNHDLSQKLLELTRTTAILPLHSLY